MSRESKPKDEAWLKFLTSMLGPEHDLRFGLKPGQQLPKPEILYERRHGGEPRPRRLWQRIHVSVQLKPQDLWIGAYVDRPGRRVYVCLLPCLPIIIEDTGAPRVTGNRIFTCEEL